MKRSDLDKFLGKQVEITLFDGEIIKGELHKTGEEKFKDNPNFYIPINYYFCVLNSKPSSCIFRCSHIKKLRESEE